MTAQLRLTNPGVQSSALPAPALSPNGRAVVSALVDAETILSAPNPAGRTRLRYLFRVPPRRTRDQCRVAARVLMHWFEAIGGFQRVDDRLVKVALAALDAHTEQELHWAIDAKAASLRPAAADDAQARRAKRLFAGSVSNFLTHKIDYWLEHSEGWRRAELQRRSNPQITQMRTDSSGHRRSSVSSVDAPSASSAPLRETLAAAALDPPRLPRSLAGLLAAAERAAPHAATYSRLWSCLDGRAQKRALAAMIPAWDSACRAAGVSPHDVRLDPLHLSERIRAAVQLCPRLLDALRPDERPTLPSVSSVDDSSASSASSADVTRRPEGLA